MILILKTYSNSNGFILYPSGLFSNYNPNTHSNSNAKQNVSDVSSSKYKPNTYSNSNNINKIHKKLFQMNTILKRVVIIIL